MLCKYLIIFTIAIIETILLNKTLKSLNFTIFNIQYVIFTYFIFLYNIFFWQFPEKIKFEDGVKFIVLIEYYYSKVASISLKYMKYLC